MSNEVSFKIKIDANSQPLDELKPKLDDVKETLEDVATNATKVGGSILELNTTLVALDSLSNLFSKLNASISELTASYALQETAETKLAQVMSNTMDATDADIQSIKELCSAQQELGVIGDEVQLAGAQELATYLEQRSSLEALIPVMNDMIAQQYGFEASQESAAGIATMLGKVMEGQTSALSRYGYSFDEAQEQILKFGTEEERAAVLAEVVSASVGGVNEKLAQTPYGKIVQASNAFGDMKEQVGRLTTALTPAINGFVGFGQGFGAIVKIREGLTVLSGIMPKVTVGVKTFCAALRGIGTIGIIGIITAITAAAVALYQAFSADLKACSMIIQ